MLVAYFWHLIPATMQPEFLMFVRLSGDLAKVQKSPISSRNLGFRGVGYLTINQGLWRSGLL